MTVSKGNIQEIPYEKLLSDNISYQRMLIKFKAKIKRLESENTTLKDILAARDITDKKSAQPINDTQKLPTLKHEQGVQTLGTGDDVERLEAELVEPLPSKNEQGVQTLSTRDDIERLA